MSFICERTTDTVKAVFIDGMGTALDERSSVGSSKIKNDGFMEQYLSSDFHEAIISNEGFGAIQQEKPQPQLDYLTIPILTVFFSTGNSRALTAANAPSPTARPTAVSVR